jgi:hypothetical protein
MDGTNGSTTFIDSGPNALAVTAVGSATVSSSQVKHGTGSAAVGGTSYLTLPNTASLFDFGAGDFTIEFWFYYSSSQTGQIQALVRSANQSGSLSPWLLNKKSGTNLMGFSWTSNGTSWILNEKTGTVAMTPNAWNHVAIVRKSGTFYSYINGALDWSDSSSSAAIQAGGDVPAIGRWPKYANSPGTFYVDDLRITTVARTITVPTAAFPDLYNPYTILPVSGAALWLSAPQTSSLYTDAGATNVIKDGDAVYQWNDLSGNNRHATQTTLANRPTWLPPAKGRSGLGAISFDGNRWIDLASNASWNFGTGNFTVEGWIKPSSYSGNRVLVGNGNNGATIYFNNAGNFRFGFYGTGTDLASASTIPTSSWTHFAVCRSGSTLRIFLNGIQSSSATATDNYGGNYSTRIGWDPVIGNGNGKYVGDLQNLIVYNNQALYTSNFTPWMS